MVIHRLTTSIRPGNEIAQSPGAARSASRRSRQQGILMAELAVAMGILLLAMIPMGYIFHQELRLCRAYYYEAVAMELVDGEMEVLAAGEWQAVPEGEHPYAVRAWAATNLPPGQFVLTRSPRALKLEWRPAQPGKGRAISREWRLP